LNLSDYGLVPHTCKTIPAGMRFGRLVVLTVGKPVGSYRYQAVCQCDCGSQPVAIRVDGLTSGRQVSCGCYHKEVTTKHGLSKHPLYNVWHHMVDRCTKLGDKSYPDYGGRGITVCERWLSVENFVADMQATYSSGLEIDRIDNDGNYEPSNCRWVGRSQQADNRRSGRRITFKGQTQSLLQWSKELNINYGTLWDRIVIWRWDVERAFTTPAISAEKRMAIARHARWGS